MFIFIKIFFTLKENILNPAKFGSHFESIIKLEFFQKIINSTFEKEKFNFIPKLNIRINGNQIAIYNGLEIPKSKNHFYIIVNFTEKEINQKYSQNEDMLRKNYTKDEKIIKTKNKYYKELDKIEEI